MQKPPIRVAVSGAAGQIAYATVFRLASGAIFGADQPLHLRLLDIPPAVGVMSGVVMELLDCAFPTLESVDIFESPEAAFDGVNWALLIGSKPRGPGMERSDLIRENGPIFVKQGMALNRGASDLRAIVVGNPCNTNCMIAMNNTDVPRDRFSAMMRLDHNRAISQLAQKASVKLTDVSQVTIWGNHSPNQYPDYENALISGRPVSEIITDDAWLANDFTKSIQNRGSEVIKVRGASSAASAGSSLLDDVRTFITPTPENDWTSSAVCSQGEYGVDEGLVFGFPVRSDGQGNIKIVEGVPLSDRGKKMFQTALEELRGERELVRDLC